jgi:hypothetical protein
MPLALKPTHATVKAYYESLHQFGQLYIDHEGAVRSAFQTLLAKCGRKAKPPLTLALNIASTAAANLRRELPRIPFASATTDCHPEEAESLAKRSTPDKGPMQLAGSTVAANGSIGPSARKERAPQDDKDVFRAIAKAGQRLAEMHVRYEQQPAINTKSQPTSAAALPTTPTAPTIRNTYFDLSGRSLA